MSDLNYLEKLLDGVEAEWRPLSDVAEYVRGLTYSKANESSDGSGYKVLRANNITLSGSTINFDDVKIVTHETKVKASQKLYKNDILISAASGSREHVGKVAFINSDIDFYFGGFMGVVRCLPGISPRFLFHVLTSGIFQKYLDEMLNSSTINNLSSSVMNDFQIPIPCPDNPKKSLEIQAEIVRILDAFTAMTAELTAELNLRKKQYNHYRDQLLSFEEGEVEWKTLGELAENLDSKRKPITSGLREAGSIPYYGASGIVDYVKDYIFDGDFLLVSEDGANLLARNTPIAFSISGKTWVNNHAHVLKFETYAERRYVEYYLNSIDLTPYISGAAQPKLNKKNLESIRIPNPSPTEKDRIVSILDKFDALTSSITEGLPREIELRQQQYEYYRDLLLSFPKPDAEVAA
ncbi:restriction endonuclease subunit S [Spongiibacter marinus]|uniref:restriction endonuclease subunit S n=1 Tax=Spongiibacter marinus TaxID=354246 RepID=UPI00041E513E|nr:restriction endonuclease subunit S [Spongiibacter marinus]